MKERKEKIEFGIEYTVSNKIAKFGNDQYFIKQAEKAKKKFKKMGWPKDFLTKINRCL